MREPYQALRETLTPLPLDAQVAAIADYLQAYIATHWVIGRPAPVLMALGEARSLVSHLWGCSVAVDHAQVDGLYRLSFRAADTGESIVQTFAWHAVRQAVVAFIRFAAANAPRQFPPFRQEVLLEMDKHHCTLLNNSCAWESCCVNGVDPDLLRDEPGSQVHVSVEVCDLLDNTEGRRVIVAGISRWYGWGDVPRMREDVARLVQDACILQGERSNARARREAESGKRAADAAAKYAEDCPLLAWAHV